MDDFDMAAEGDAAEVQPDTDAAVAVGPASSTGAPALPNPLHLRLVADPKMRFVLELEFVELLASPQYLQFLAQSRYLTDPAFLNYLSYLQYWHQPAYIQFLTHPHCLYFLDLLQTSAFRSALLSPNYVDLIHTQQFFHWTSWRYNRYMEQQAAIERRKAIEADRRDEESKEGEEASDTLQGQ